MSFTALCYLLLHSAAFHCTPPLFAALRHFCCTLLLFTALHCFLLHSAAFHCTPLLFAALHCFSLHSTAFCCTPLFFTALRCFLLHSTVFCCTPLSFAALHRLLLHSVTIFARIASRIIRVSWLVYLEKNLIHLYLPKLSHIPKRKKSYFSLFD